MKKKKLYIVSREVLATSIKEALLAKGTVYSVVEAANQPAPETKAGFKKENGNN